MNESQRVGNMQSINSKVIGMIALRSVLVAFFSKV